MKVVAVLAVIASLEARAQAGSCGDRGDDGGSSDSSSSSSESSSSSSSSSDATPACVEVSGVVGRQQCGRYGAWSIARFSPILTLESGVSVRRVSLDGVAFGGEVDHGAEGSYQYRLVGDELADVATLVTADLRILGGRTIYGGAELGVGGVAADESQMAATTSGAPERASMTPSVQMSFGYGAVLGVRLPLGKLRASAEVFAGGRTLQLSVDSALGACETTDASYATRFSVEPRARLEAWVSPWFTLGAFAGTDLVSSAPSFGAFLSGHTRAFDGQR